MGETMQQLETYFESLKTQGAGLPSRVESNVPHFRAISAASGIDFGYLTKEPYKQRVLLAVEEIGLTLEGDTKAARSEAVFLQNHAKLDKYLQWLKDSKFKLPEDPSHRGRVFFAQVAVEAGLPPNVLALRTIDSERAGNVRLRQLVEKAASKLGFEVRVLTQSPGHKQIPFTYKLLLERGMEERKKELKDSRCPEAQLSNTRYALNLFLRVLKIEATALVGPEFVAGFDKSVEKVIGEISNIHSRKKFNTEIHRCQDIYQRLLKGPSIPDEFQQAIAHLVDRSGLSLSILAKLLDVARETLKAWYQGSGTPSLLSVRALERMESLFKIPAGTLVNNIPGLRGRRRFRRSDLPPFLQQNLELFNRISKHLPDNFCTLPLEAQEEIVESIRTDILRGGDEYGQRLLILSSLPYRLKKWPAPVRDEFESYTDFKTGMWKSATKKKRKDDLDYFFGGICLTPDAEDERLRGLGFQKSQLTLALLICPELIKWYIEFRCEVRNQYTEYPISLLHDFISMLRPGTGWLRESPHLASRLRPFAEGDARYVSEDLVSRAQTDWGGVCDDAIEEFEKKIENIKPLASVARDPFLRVKGLLELDAPMEAYGVLIQEMKRDLPSPHTQPVLYHTGIRDLAVTIVIVVTGFRRGILPKLDYTGDKTGHLYFEDGHYVLSVPRIFFKNPDSSYFHSNRVKEDYLNELPDVFGLNEVFKEYLEVSRPFLMKTYHTRSSEQPLFITSFKARNAGTEPDSPRLMDARVSSIFANKVEKHLVENKHRGTGIQGVKKSGPHSVRHVRGTTVYRKTGSYKQAGDANQHSEEMARKHYSRITTKERNKKVSQILF